VRVLVTGATGFVGTAVLPALRARGHVVRAAVRREVDCDADEQVRVGDLSPDTDWREALAGVDAVVHLAARVHVMHDASTNPLAEFRRSNVEGTLTLARAAARASAKRLVFLSSIKVNGEATTDRAFTERDAPAPRDPYGVSKAEAEEALRGVAVETGLEVVILRPPLVYGPGVRANFLRLLRFADRGVPLPFGAVDNRRSMVFVANLADAIVRCIEHPGAAGRTFLASDGEDLSTADLIRRLAAALGKRASLVPVPPGLMRAAARLLGKGAEADRLLGSLRIDSSALRESLGWRPPFTVDEGLAATAAWYQSASRAPE
jgi:nucleoside-diphosphate-sugar epimerase